MDSRPQIQRRFRVMRVVVAVSFALLVGRMVQVQAVRGARYARLAEDNVVAEEALPAVRGRILDAHGRELAGNRPGYDLYVTPAFLREDTLGRLLELMEVRGADAEALSARVGAQRGRARLRELRLLRDIDRDRLARVETHRLDLPGVRVHVVPQRRYPHGALAAHAIGYMNEISAEELRERGGQGYAIGDRIGRSGVERAFEDLLRGRDGRRPVVADATGTARDREDARRLGLSAALASHESIEPAPGRDLALTLDLDLQRAVERELARFDAAAAVVIETGSGRVRAIASRPAYDPGEMSGRLTVERQRQLVSDPNRPLVDKAVREHYFPGSTYKVVPALAALQEGLVEPREKLVCRGWHELGRRTFRCPQAHGAVDLAQALVRSCNVFFYQLAERVGMDRIAETARGFGLGEPTGLGINGEAAGFLPTREWYLGHEKEFRLGYTLNAAIGQGNTKATVLQVASLYAAIADGGRVMRPRIVEHALAPDGRRAREFPPEVARRAPVAPAHLAYVARALEGVLSDPAGTAYEVRGEAGVPVAGKTGTAQLWRGTGEPRRDHAWFAGWAPAGRPEIAIAVLIEHGGAGGRTAAPAAMRMLREYFRTHDVPAPWPERAADFTAGGGPEPAAALPADD